LRLLVLKRIDNGASRDGIKVGRRGRCLLGQLGSKVEGGEEALFARAKDPHPPRCRLVRLCSPRKRLGPIRKVAVPSMFRFQSIVRRLGSG